MHECGLFLRRHGHPVRLRTAAAGFGLVALSLVDGAAFGVGVRCIGHTYADQANLISVPAYTVVDATIHYDFGAVNPNLKGLTFRVNASNLLETVYASQCTSLNIFGPY